ncbi:MAG: hypothetical protein GY920_20300 [Aliivibrio sp.]|nr:hypothetical protein [Aliivibrio sp.]MCP4322121.1 hypothetical protein [Alteromonadales bacterium]
MSNTSKGLNHVSNQVNEYAQWIKAHLVGIEWTLEKTAREKGIPSPNFELELLKFNTELRKLQDQLELLEWLQGVIKDAK